MNRLILVLLVCAQFALAAFDAAAQTASRRTFLKLVEVQELWANDDFTGAMIALDELADDTAGDPYDFALVQQYIAHTAVQSGEMELALPALDKALAQPGLPAPLLAELNMLYGQLLIGEEEFERAREMLELWYNTTEAAKQAPQVFSLSYACYMTGDLGAAEAYMEEVLDLSPTINDSWYRVYYQILFEQKKYQRAEQVLYELLTRDPVKEEYWRLLANHYLQVEQSRDALAAMSISHLQGNLESPEDLRRLASLYGYVEIPEKAARLMEAWVADTTLPSDYETLRRLGDLWLMARDRAKAKEYLSLAADVSPDGSTWEVLGSLAFEDESWRTAYDAYLKAIDAGGIDDVERVHLLAGVSAYYAGMTNEARAALEEAKESDKHREQALNMLRRLNES